MTEQVVATDAFVGQAYLMVGNGASPEIFTRYCEVYDLSELGAKNDQVEATTFCSGGSKQFIPGLSEGQEFTFQANYALENTIQEELIDATDAQETKNFKLQMGDDSPAAREFSFALALLSWGVTPSLEGKNVIKFVGKITGPIGRSVI